MKSECLLAFGFLLLSLASSQTLLQVLSAHSQLSSLSSYITSFPSLAQQLKTADNFTFLAPTNDALSIWPAGNHSSDYIEATLTYHLLNGTYTSVDLSATPLFIRSALTSKSYCNVTGGQRVKAVNDGHIVFGSALNTNSTVLTADIIATGGIVYIIDTVLYIPFDAVETIAALNLSYYIAIANEAGFLSAEDRPFVESIGELPDLTEAFANSPQALAQLNGTNLNQTGWEQAVKYEIVEELNYSTEFRNGTTLMTMAGLPWLITVQDGDIWINTAKITLRDLLITNGVFHVLDVLLGPSNTTRPYFPSNQSNSSTTSTASSTTNQPMSSAPYFSSYPNSGLTTSAKTGIGIGVAGGVIAVVVVAAVIVCRRKRRFRAAEREKDQGWNNEGQPGELSSNPLDEMPQLETMESAVELPAEYVAHGQIGRAH